MNSLQELIKNNSNWRELLDSKKIKIKEDDNFLIFNYDIGANFSDEVVKDCRGIILDKNDFSIACNPFRKFGNYFESYADNIDWSSARVQEKLDGCFSRHDCVMLADGTKKQISEIVNKKLNCEVLSYNFEKQIIEPKKVVGWKKSPSNFNNDEWLSFHLRGVKQDLTVKSQSQHQLLTLTKNHKLFVRRDDKIVEICADECVEGDILLTPTESLTSTEYQVILGGMLGDGSMNYYKKKWAYPGFRFSHSLKQKEYAYFKASLLENLGLTIKESKVNNSFGKYKINVSTHTNAAMSIIRKLCYNDKHKKHITNEWLQQLDWLGFAIWYMDDGSLNKSCKNNSIHLHTEGYSKDENETIHNFFNDRGLKNYVRQYRGYYMINFSTEASEKIWNYIREFIPECMQYKLPVRHQGFFKTINTKDERRTLILIDSCLEKIEHGMNRKMGKYGTKKYDLEVEDNHNYFCGGVLVHNSIIKLFFNKYTSSWQWATNSTIDSRNATINSLRFKNYFEMLIRADNFYDLRDIDTNYTYLFELVGPENQIVLKYDKIHLYHIGTRHNESGQEINVDIGIEKPKEYKLSNFDDCLKAIKELNKDGLNHEGFVVVDKYYNRIKIKTPEYVAMHHLSNNGETITNKAKVVELLKSDDFNEGELLKQYPNYRKVFNHYKSEMARVEKELDDYILYARAHYKMSKGDRKYVANKIKDIKYSSVLFKSLGNNKTVKELLNDCSDKLYLSWIDDYKE